MCGGLFDLLIFFTRGVRNCCASGSKTPQRQSHESAVLYTTWLWSIVRATWWIETAIFIRSGTDPLQHLYTASGTSPFSFSLSFSSPFSATVSSWSSFVVRQESWQATVDWTKYLSGEPVAPDSNQRDQHDDHRKCSLHHYMEADLRLLYATAHHAEPQSVHSRLLCPDFLGISLHLRKPVHLRH